MYSIPDFNLGQLIDPCKFSRPALDKPESYGPDIEMIEWRRQNIGFGRGKSYTSIPPGDPLEAIDDIRNMVRRLDQGEGDQWENRFRPQKNVFSPAEKKDPKSLMTRVKQIFKNLNNNNISDSLKSLKELMQGKYTSQDFADPKIIEWIKKLLIVMPDAEVEHHKIIIEILNCFEQIKVFEVTCDPLLKIMMTKYIKESDGSKLKNCCSFLCKFYFTSLKGNPKFSSSTFLNYILEQCQNLLAYESGDLESFYIIRIDCATYILKKIGNKLDYNQDMLKEMLHRVWEVQTSDKISSLIHQKLLDLLLLWSWSVYYTSPYLEKNAYPVIEHFSKSNRVDKFTQTSSIILKETSVQTLTSSL